MIYSTLKIKFGMYKYTELKNIPDNYLLWLYKQGVKGKIKLHIQHRFNMPKNKYKITVSDSINSDGEYIVMAYNSNEAIINCQKQYKIQNTQSFHGTEYNIKQIN